MNKTILNPYHSSPGKFINEGKLKLLLEGYIISGEKYNLDVGPGETTTPIFITGWDSASNNIPDIPFPIFVNHNGKQYLITDVRAYTKSAPDDVEDYTKYIKNKAEFEFIRNIAIFMIALEDDGRDLVNSLGTVPMVVYSRWITKSISRTFSLNPYDASVVSLVISVFFRSMFYDNVGTDDMDAINAYISNTSMLKDDDVGNIISSLVRNTDHTIYDMANNIKRGVGGTTLGSLDGDTIINLISRSWYGKDATRTITIAVENPAYWLAMLHTVSTNNSYKKTSIADTLNSSSKKSLITSYVDASNSVISTYLD